MDIRLKKAGKSYIKLLLVSKAHKTKFHCCAYVLRDGLFNGNNIHIARCRHHTGYKYGGQKAEVVSVRQMLPTSQRCKTVVYWRGGVVDEGSRGLEVNCVPASRTERFHRYVENAIENRSALSSLPRLPLSHNVHGTLDRSRSPVNLSSSPYTC